LVSLGIGESSAVELGEAASLDDDDAVVLLVGGPLLEGRGVEGDHVGGEGGGVGLGAQL